MFKAFNLKIEEGDITRYLPQGDYVTNNYKIKLEDLCNDNGDLDGTKIRKEWFPIIDADVFISHAHKDERLARAFATYLENDFGLKSFIDFDIWGHAHELLKEIDSKFCLLNGGPSYDYDKRNGSTAHVHMILSSALAQVIDKTECVFFLNGYVPVKCVYYSCS